jgi:hypothetical protein
MVTAVSQADTSERVLGPAAPFRPANAGINKRQLNIFLRRCSCQKRRQLKYEPNISASDRCTCGLIQLLDGTAVQGIFAVIRCFQEAQKIEQSGLSRPRAALDGDEFTVFYRD